MRVRSFVLIAVLSIVSRTSWAQVADDEAKARVEQGLNLAAQGKWEHARLAFLEAYTIIPTSVQLLWNLSYAEFKSGHVIEALEHFKKYERDPRAEPAKIAALPKLREQAYQKVGRVKVQAPPAATVSMDGTQTPWAEPVDVQPGDHKIAVKVAESVQEQSFSIVAGQVLQLPFSFPDTPRASTPPSGLPPPDPPRGESKARYWVSGGLAVGAIAAAGVGVGFGLTANSEKDSIEEKRAAMGLSCDPSDVSCADAQRTHVDMARGFLIGSGVLATAAIVTFFAWPSSSATPTGVVVLPRAGGADLAFTTRF